MKKSPKDILLKNIKYKFEDIRDLLKVVNSPWGYEDLIYRFYHQSYEVITIQNITEKIVNLLRSLAPEGCSFNRFFKEIFVEATGKKIENSNNKNWTQITRPIVEAFFHAKYFLEMAFKYGSELAESPKLMPSGWA